MYTSRASIVRLMAAFGLIMLAVASLCWPHAAASTEEGAEVLSVNASEPSAPAAYMPITLDDLRRDEDLTIVQDSNGPAVRVFEVCQSVSGYADFEPNPAHEFARSLFGRAWLYTEIEEFSCRVEPDGDYSFSLSADIVLWDAEARAAWRKARVISFEQTVASRPSGVWAYAYVPTIFISKGEYNVEITIHDNLSGAQSRVNTLMRIK